MGIKRQGNTYSAAMKIKYYEKINKNFLLISKRSISKNLTAISISDFIPVTRYEKTFAKKFEENQATYSKLK